MSKNGNIQLVAKLDKLLTKKILIEVKNLEKGNYELDIIHKNKIITKTTFKKK